MFAARHPDRGWQHFFLSRNAYIAHWNHPSTVRRVRVIVDPEGPFWGWRYALSHDSFSGQISMIFSRRLLVEVCFPYGTKAEEKGKVEWFDFGSKIWANDFCSLVMYFR